MEGEVALMESVVKCDSINQIPIVLANTSITTISICNGEEVRKATVVYINKEKIYKKTKKHATSGKKIILSKLSGTVKWFNVKSRYGFINWEDPKEDFFVNQTAIIKNNPHKYLRSVKDCEKVEFDVVKGREG